MLKKEVDKFNSFMNRLESLVYSLKGKNYDFTEFLSNQQEIDTLILKLDDFEKEKVKQDKMKEKVKEVISSEIKSSLVNEGTNFDDLFESNIRVEDFGNYYILWLYGICSFNVNYVFDKNGDLLLDNKNILGIDNDNFFMFSYDSKMMCDKLYHYQFNEKNFVLVNVLDNVVDVDYNDFFSKELVVCSYGDNRILYNYRSKEIVIPSYSSLHSDIGIFGELVETEDYYVRLTKKIYGIKNYKSVLIGNLEFLVDRKGKIDSCIFDFENNECYYLTGENQEEAVDSIYDTVKNSYRLSVKRKIKKQN